MPMTAAWSGETRSVVLHAPLTRHIATIARTLRSIRGGINPIQLNRQRDQFVEVQCVRA